MSSYRYLFYLAQDKGEMIYYRNRKLLPGVGSNTTIPNKR